MGYLNKVMLIGNLGADVELKYTPSNKAVCNLSIATTETWKDKSGQKQEKTEWHRVTVWEEMAKNCAKYLSKGRSVYVEGRLQTRSYEKDGQKHYATDIQASVVTFLGGGEKKDGESRGGGDSRRGGGQGNRQYGGGQSAPPPSDETSGGDGGPIGDDDIPF